jgi:hypothetical protein
MQEFVVSTLCSSSYTLSDLKEEREDAIIPKYSLHIIQIIQRLLKQVATGRCCACHSRISTEFSQFSAF